MSENPIDGLRIDQFGAEAQRQLASIILAAVKREKRGRGRPSDPYVKKDRAFVAKELVEHRPNAAKSPPVLFDDFRGHGLADFLNLLLHRQPPTN